MMSLASRLKEREKQRTRRSKGGKDESLQKCSSSFFAALDLFHEVPFFQAYNQHPLLQRKQKMFGLDGRHVLSKL